MKQAALQALALFALPVGIVGGAEKDDVFARHISRPAWRREHLAPHDLFDLARHRNQKVIPLRARARLALLVKVFLTINPFAQALKPFHCCSSSTLVSRSPLPAILRRPGSDSQSVFTNCRLTQPLSGAPEGVPPAQLKTRTRSQL